MSIGFILFLATLALLAISGMLAYNGLVAARNAVNNAFARVDTRLQRRHDLIPNLVEAVKGYMRHEQQTLNQVVAARQSAGQARALVGGDPSDAVAMIALTNAEQALGGALGRLFALAENYPDLKASQNLLRLQEELSGTEEQIAQARELYNDAVLRYNNRLQSLPTNLIAHLFAFREAPMWKLHDSAAREVPRIAF